MEKTTPKHWHQSKKFWDLTLTECWWGSHYWKYIERKVSKLALDYDPDYMLSQ